MLGYYARFMALFPTVYDLAAAPEETLLKAWEGLGYYSRARNLQKAARCIVAEHEGRFPHNPTVLRSLPGIGPYTAGAIASIAFGLPMAAVDGNALRVASRLLGIREDITLPSVKRDVEARISALLPEGRPGDFNQAIMDLGATLCSPGNPKCDRCPLADICDAYREGDAESLPVKSRKTPPKPVAVAMLLAFCENRVFLCKRREALLHGLWVFPLTEGSASPASARQLAATLGLEGKAIKKAGEARHVSTHKIWNITLYILHTGEMTTTEDGCWADKEALLALPLPSAVSTAKAVALAQLKG